MSRRNGKGVLRIAAVALGMVLVSAGGEAHAQYDQDGRDGNNGAYLDLSIGGGALNSLGDSDGFTTDFLPGPMISGAIGYKWRRLRFEGSVLYAEFLIDEQTGPGGTERERPPPPTLCFLCGTSGLNGDLSTLAFMANAYLDFDLGARTQLFIGGGIGAARVAAEYEFDGIVVGIFPTGESVTFIDDSETVFAYQARAGIGFGLTDNSELYLGYRYFATEDQTFDVEGGGRLQQDGLGAHMGEIGVRLHF